MTMRLEALQLVLASQLQLVLAPQFQWAFDRCRVCLLECQSESLLEYLLEIPLALGKV
jgi:hypothetical protein